MKTFLVYVAGPFTASNDWSMAENVREIERWGLRLASLKITGGQIWPMMPHPMTRNFFKAVSEDQAMAGCFEMVKCCHAMVMIPDWQISRGTLQEKVFAEGEGVPVFTTDELEQLIRLLENLA
jgi:hypothetical protein